MDLKNHQYSHIIIIIIILLLCVYQIILCFIRCQQRLLSRCELRLEQTFSEHSDCHETAERCSMEVERLRRERETLVQRLHDIDSDIERVNIVT